MTGTATAEDGAALAFSCSGRPGAPALLFLNSIGCDRSLWTRQEEAFADRFRCIVFDMRGHGASEAPAADYTIAQLGRDALAVLEAADAPGAAHVCGLSLGGLVAQWLGAHAPERVASLTLAATASRIGAPDAWEARRRLVLSEGLDAIADMAMARFFSDGFRARQPAIVAEQRARLLQGSAAGYAGCCAALRDADLAPDLARIRAPTLVIGGRHDISTPPEQAAALAQQIGGARLAVLEAAHLCNVEAPAEFNARLRAHLEASDG